MWTRSAAQAVAASLVDGLIARFAKAASRAVDAGFVLPEDADVLKAAAAASPLVD